MNLLDSEIYKIILAPLTTEKTNSASERYNRLTFKVANWANKVQIKNAIQKLFGVDVVQVATLNVAGKYKNFKRRKGKRSDWKKAVIKLKEQQDINIAEYLKS